MKDTKEYAITIIDIFEDLLNKHDIAIPDKFREGNEDEASIYGETFDELLNDIETIVCAIKRESDCPWRGFKCHDLSVSVCENNTKI